MDWLGLALGLVKLGLALFNHFEGKAKEKIGEDRERLKQFTALEELRTALDAVDLRFSKMTDEDVKEEITKKGYWRD